jgi:pimeloyl-ACP methyl ester carboxylesterase
VFMDHRSSTAPVEPHDVTRRYIEVAGRAIHYRVLGDGPAIVMLHDSPRSSRLHLATMRALSQRFRIYALDTPGYGNSEPLDKADPTIADFAAALASAIHALGIESAPIYATHTSAKIALEYAANRINDRPLEAKRTKTVQRGRVILDGLSIPISPADPAFITAYMRPFVLDDAGGYLAAEWTRMRDMLRWFPWFDQSPTTRMPVAQPADAWISAYMIDFLSAGPSYASAYAAAMRYDPTPALMRVSSPVLVAARADDVLYASLDRVPVEHNPALTVERLPADPVGWLAWLENALAAAVVDAPVAPPLAAQPAAGAAYVDLPHGQMRVHRSGTAGDRPLLILSAPTTLQGLAWQAALPERATLVPELPGFGESDPLPSPTLDGMADALAAMLQQLGFDEVDLLATGLATPMGCMFTKRHPDLVTVVVLDGCDLDTASVSRDRIAPAFPFDPGGGHIHRYLHMLRDSEANWPWFDGSASAARGLSPSLAAGPLHDALVGILKQPEHYGDAARAVYQDADDFAQLLQPVLLLNHATDPAYRGTDALASRLTRSTVADRPSDLATTAHIVSRFLNEAALLTETLA